jgi:hypothetical protein
MAVKRISKAWGIRPQFSSQNSCNWHRSKQWSGEM